MGAVGGCGVELPQVGGWGPVAHENALRSTVDVDMHAAEECRAATVTELTNGKQGFAGEVGNNVCKACMWWQAREVQFGHVGGEHGGPVGVVNGDGGGCWLNIVERE